MENLGPLVFGAENNGLCDFIFNFLLLARNTGRPLWIEMTNSTFGSNKANPGYIKFHQQPKEGHNR